MQTKKPTQIAEELKSLVYELGTARAAAEKLGMSPATASRYLRVLRLTKEEREAIDSGSAPIRKKRPKMRSTVQSSDREITIVELLAKSTFATTSQVSEFTGLSISTTRNALQRLIAKSLVERDEQFSPHVLSLTTRGSTLAGISKPKHYFSSAAIHQYLLRNSIEIEMKETNPSALFVTRTRLWNMGLFPSVGEHAVRFDSKGEKKLALVIIDDYAMNPERIPHALNRLHDKEKSYVSGDVVLSWKDAVDRLLIYATTDKQLDNHRRYFNKNKKLFPLVPALRRVEPIWSIA